MTRRRTLPLLSWLALLGAVPAVAGVDPRGDGPTWSYADPQGDGAWPVVTLADTNGDDVQDVIVVDPIVDQADRGLDDDTRMLVFLGGASMSATPDQIFDATSLTPTQAHGAWGDLDGDGDDDFVTWIPGESDGARDIVVRRGGVGGLGAVEALNVQDPYNPTGFSEKVPIGRIEDLNGDGFGDVMMRQDGGPSREGQIVFSVHLGTATGVERAASWSYAFDWEGLLDTTLTVIGDLDADGYLEVAAVSTLDIGTGLVSEIDVFRGDVTGPRDFFWTSMLLGAVSSPSDLTTWSGGDLDGDGRDDVLVSVAPHVSGEASRLLSFHGDVNYGFRISDPVVEWQDTSGGEVTVLGVGDFDGDDVSDIAIGLKGLPDPLGVSAATGGVALGLARDVWFSRRTFLQFLASGDDRGFGALGGVGDTSGDGLADLVVGVPGVLGAQVGTVQRFLGFIDHDLDHADDDVDCVPDDAAVYPGATEIWYDAVDQDCDGNDADQDLDGVPAPDDCDDLDAARRPGAVEVFYDGVDQDCDGNDADQDGDGAIADSAGGDDCDDADPLVGPFAEEIADNGLDDDCVGGDAPAVLDAPSCGCASRAASGATAWPFVLAALIRRRRALRR